MGMASDLRRALAVAVAVVFHKHILVQFARRDEAQLQVPL
jgi:hypothetical protein